MIAQGKRCFVHSDLGKGVIIAKRYGHKIESRAIPRSCLRFLVETFNGNEELLSFPSFNYSYGRTRHFDVLKDQVQVGVLPEWVRGTKLLRRSEVPFFSTLSNETPLEFNEEPINPFGNDSHFRTLYDENGYIVLFGSEISSMTLIHFIEELAGGPLYRYDKFFPGHITTAEGKVRSCNVRMHVRPMGVEFEYDWGKMTSDLKDQGIYQESDVTNELRWMPVKPLTDFFLQKISDDPLYLLDEATRDRFKTQTRSMKRVQIESYEND